MYSNYLIFYILWKLINFYKSDLFGEKISDFFCNICMCGILYLVKGLSKIKVWYEFFYGKNLRY